MPISALTQSTVRAIGAGQVHADPSAVIKELIDNALDAHATSISVQVSANTIDSIRVCDNGHGIAPMDRAMVARRHCTSKISSEHDLRNVGGSTLGFRGEALACAAGLSGTLTISTRIEGEPTAAVLMINRHGEIEKTERATLPVGTTVRITELFSTQPVRKQLALKNPEKCISKIKQMLQSYAFARGSVRLSFRVLRSRGGKDDLTYAPKDKGDALDVAFKLFGTACASQYTWSTMSEGGFCLQALLPRPYADLGKIGGLGSFISIDARPMSSARGICKQICKLFRGVLEQSTEINGTIKDPFFYLEIRCPAGSYDANVEPAKDDVILERPDNILQLVQKLFNTFYCDSRQQSMLELPNQTVEVQTETLTAQEGSPFSVRTSGATDRASVSVVSNEDAIPSDQVSSDQQVTFRSNMYGRDEDDLSILSAQAEGSEDPEELQEARMDIKLSNPWVLAKLNATQRYRSQADTEANTVPDASCGSAVSSLPLRSQVRTHRIAQLNNLPTPQSSSLPPVCSLDRDDNTGFEATGDERTEPSLPLPVFTLPTPRSPHASQILHDERAVAYHGVYPSDGNQMPASSVHSSSQGTALSDIPNVGRRSLRSPRASLPKHGPKMASLPTERHRLQREKVWFDHLEGSQPTQPRLRAKRRKYQEQGTELVTPGELHLAGDSRLLSRPNQNHDIRDFVNIAENVDVSGSMQMSDQIQQQPDQTPVTRVDPELRRTQEQINGNAPYNGKDFVSAREYVAMEARFGLNEAHGVRKSSRRKPGGAIDPGQQHSSAAAFSEARTDGDISQGRKRSLRSRGGASAGPHRTISSWVPLERTPTGQGTHGVVQQCTNPMTEIVQSLGSMNAESLFIAINASGYAEDNAFAGISPDLESIAYRLHYLLLSTNKFSCVHGTADASVKALCQILQDTLTPCTRDGQGDDDDMLDV